MANVRPGGQPSHEQFQTSAQIKKTMKPAYARDDIDNAFAGEENKGPAGTKTDLSHSTNVKSRKSKLSRGKTPKR